MDPSRELVDAAQVGTALAVLSGAALVVALGSFAAARRRRTPALVKAGLLGGAGVLVYPLWQVYNGIEDHFGLDSVLALLLNLGLFVMIGIALGVALRRFWPTDPVAHQSVAHRRETEQHETSQSPSPLA